MEEDNKGTALSNVIRIDDDRVKEHLDKVVGRSALQRRAIRTV
jgi:predicted SnoaL-like aldol condensation-catalyzing enzyme